MDSQHFLQWSDDSLARSAIDSSMKLFTYAEAAKPFTFMEEHMKGLAKIQEDSWSVMKHFAPEYSKILSCQEEFLRFSKDQEDYLKMYSCAEEAMKLFSCDALQDELKRMREVDEALRSQKEKFDKLYASHSSIFDSVERVAKTSALPTASFIQDVVDAIKPMASVAQGILDTREALVGSSFLESFLASKESGETVFPDYGHWAGDDEWSSAMEYFLAHAPVLISAEEWAEFERKVKNCTRVIDYLSVIDSLIVSDPKQHTVLVLIFWRKPEIGNGAHLARSFIASSFFVN